MISFDTVMDWQEEHRFLKTAFDTALLCDGARSEIQFGHIRRSNRRSTDAEKARHEVCNHKFTDLSEASYGIALLNDCKYGLSVSGGQHAPCRLHKGGMRPDQEGDKGIHRCRYAILPHAAPFSSQSVIRPAYAFNYAPIVIQGGAAPVSLAAIDKKNIVIEAIKPCEDATRAYIVRLYEAMGDYTTASMNLRPSGDEHTGMQHAGRGTGGGRRQRAHLPPVRDQNDQGELLTHKQHVKGKADERTYGQGNQIFVSLGYENPK